MTFPIDVEVMTQALIDSAGLPPVNEEGMAQRVLEQLERRGYALHLARHPVFQPARLDGTNEVPWMCQGCGSITWSVSANTDPGQCYMGPHGWKKGETSDTWKLLHMEVKPDATNEAVSAAAGVVTASEILRRAGACTCRTTPIAERTEPGWRCPKHGAIV